MTINLEVDLAAHIEPPRDRWGRYLIVPAAGGKARSYTRATTWAGAIDDKEGLINWSMRMCAVGLAARKDLFAQVASCSPGDRDTLKKLVEQAKEAGGGSEGANLGTALHRFTQRIDGGETVTVPDQWTADIGAYRQALADAHLEVIAEHIERIVVLEELGIAGTFDRIYRTSDGRLVIGDLKTGQSLDFSRLSIAVQLALYAHAETIYDWQTETHTPMVDVDRERALVVHVPVGQGRASVEEFDITWGWERVKQAGLVRESRSAAKRKNVVSWTYKPANGPTPIGDTLTAAVAVLANVEDDPVTPGFRDHVLARLERLKADYPDSAALLKARWPEGMPGMRSDYAHTDADLRLIVTRLEEVEAELKPAEVDEGRRMEAQDVAAVIARYEALTAEQRAVLASWAKEANAAGVSFNLRLVPSQRRFEIYRACLRLAELIDGDDLDLCRATVAGVIPTVAFPTVAIGHALGSLTIAEAELLVRLAEAVRTDEPALQYDLQGGVSWRWPDDATTNNDTLEKAHDY